jgi:predicted ATPase/DNA-binding CsgD family transcriptional regulator
MTDRVGQYLGNDRLVHLHGRGSFADVYLKSHLQNFPAQVTPLIGREQEVVAVVDLLGRPEVRELTLTGTGGIGKTRLGLQVAGELLDTFADGVYFVPLAPISEPALVAVTIAQTLGIKETGERSLLDLLKHFLQDKHVLLLLDNFEQVTAAATVLAELLAACPYLKLLVTSRAMLRVRGEHEFRVPPLALPDLAQLPGSEALLQYPAIVLFLDRALAIKPDFAVTEANVRVIAEICTRLDGLPLAIELAAVRVKLLPPQSLLQRLEHRLQILTGGAQDLPERQQTLRNTIAWSYYLLDGQEQRLFRRLCIFVGGFTLEAIEATCGAFGDGALAMLNQVASLMDKSLLQQSEQDRGGGGGGEGGEEPRFGMLETIREYGLEALGESNEVERMRQAHAAYYLSLAERAEPELGGPQQALWLGRLERDHDNLRVAMRWLMDDGREGKDRVMALRLGGALRRFWIVHSHISEGRNFLDNALAASEGVKELDAAVRAKALITAANLAVIQSDYQRAEVLATESLELFRELGDQSGVALSLYLLGTSAWTQGNSEATRTLTEEALAISRALGDKDRVAWSLYTLGMWHSSRGEYVGARALFEESLVMHRELGSKRGMASALTELAQLLFVSQGDAATIHDLVEEGQALFRELGYKEGIADSLGLAGKIALKEGEVDTARQLADESMKLYKEVGFRWGMVSSLCLLAKVTARQGDRAGARKLYEESLALASEVGRKELIATSLEGLASIVAAEGEPAWAAQLWGAAGSLRTAIGVSVAPVELADYEQAMAAAREQLGKKIFEARWVEGMEMTPEQAMAAQGVGSVLSTVSKGTSAPIYVAGLTAREVEVLRLVVRGMTNMQIAQELVLSEKTVATHLSHIFNKTNSENRAGAVAFAIRHGLA